MRVERLYSWIGFSLTATLLVCCSGLVQAHNPGAKKPPPDYAAEKKTAPVSEKKPADLIDINSATGEQLQALLVIDDAYSKKIIDGRPYKMKTDFKARKINRDAAYDKIAGMIIDKQK